MNTPSDKEQKIEEVLIGVWNQGREHTSRYSAVKDARASIESLVLDVIGEAIPMHGFAKEEYKQWWKRSQEVLLKSQTERLKQALAPTNPQTEEDVK